MLKTAERLISKLLEHDSQVLALGYISRKISNATGSGSDRSPGPEPFSAVQNGISKGKALTFGSGANSLYGSGLHTRETSPSTRQLLGILGVVADNDICKDTLSQRLNITAVDQERKLDLRSTETERMLLSTVATSTKDSSDAQQLLLNALLIDTMFANVNMSTVDLQIRKKRLNKTIENIGTGLGYLDIGKLRDHSRTQKDFVDRWNTG